MRRLPGAAGLGGQSEWWRLARLTLIVAAVIAGVLLVGWVGLIVLRAKIILWLYGALALWLNTNLNLDDLQSRLLAVALTAVLVPALPYVISFGFKRRHRWVLTLVALVVASGLFALLQLFGGDVFFKADGTPLRCYEMTPAGIKVRRTAGYDRTYAVKCIPITRQIVPSVLNAQRGITPQTLDPVDLNPDALFKPSNGAPAVYYRRRPDGSYDLFAGPGFDPRTRQPLLPVDPDSAPAVAAYIRQKQQAHQEQLRQQAAKQAQELAEDRRVLEQKMQAAAAEDKRQVAQAAEAQRVLEQKMQAAAAEKKLQTAQAVEAQRQADIKQTVDTATRDYRGGDRLGAKHALDDLLGRYPHDRQAADLYARWDLGRACDDCGTVATVGSGAGYWSPDPEWGWPVLRHAVVLSVRMDSGTTYTLSLPAFTRVTLGEHIKLDYLAGGQVQIAPVP